MLNDRLLGEPWGTEGVQIVRRKFPRILSVVDEAFGPMSRTLLPYSSALEHRPSEDSVQLTARQKNK
jgi:hypothetical protein